MKIYLAADHAGYELKEKLKKVLADLNYDTEDFGPLELTPEDDYPDYVAPAMQALQNDHKSKAIVMCKNGVGVSMMANKYKGIRAGLSFSKKHATTARTDDDINVLALPANYIKFEDAVETVAAFLNTPFSNNTRHTRRLNKIQKIEK